MADNNSKQSSLYGNYQSWVQRNGFADWALALIWIVVAFGLFQLVGGIVGGLLVISEYGATPNPAEMQALLGQHPDLLIIGNSIGQVLVMGLGTWFITKLHTSGETQLSFLRFNADKNTPKNIGLAVILIFVIQPTIMFLAWINSFLPVPEFFTQMQNTQMKMIESLLTSDLTIWVMLFHVAVVPAICEELLYRGYVMRSFQKNWGILAAIIVSGLLFGMYHVQLSNLLPLATLGIVFAFLTWTSKSVYPAIVAHFVNNAGSVVMGKYYPESAFAKIAPETLPPIFVVIPSLLFSGFIVYFIYKKYTINTA
ncbi:hypothetical protein LX73_2487 [Fodinibius salinus]|uniref:CAAX prenyl protease 2/Lysostaphin resistance protein A-like domain-containing protein n=1 Tax=Fodinibius salinus TaxID=860790 RepID=A0A5D3YF79_9BACT|nr:CPBP family intramembrane glutamic endopeptidase [Fodinibius salinus]TYP91663.1 hypothetical protein LX73_2487 [Fodinibius salinus]